eukprot:CAMPEP_0204909298 /NCGR_PEP_ID=MMETSP1397-20131031/8051_1 /ASSEMBLY_ACC=CAM_ASM_000891 /TAXON_ID=49980 /ORGANISM="Climacostomum Climacostomum virens, Strain Stock W-24" /LENGTH=334 /DNA_ID=CAMNT_0052079087 /DNA_START=94 /DNA_END=1095 /DNA_ORIENTATION=+
MYVDSTWHNDQADRIRSLLTEPGLRERVAKALEKQGLPANSNTLKLELTGFNEEFCFDTEDARDVCSLFGEIASLKIEDGQCYVAFTDPLCAFFAQRTLNERQLLKSGGGLRVSWHHEATPQVWTQPPAIVFEPPRLDNYKYTCRYDIQIENEKDFQVARRLIGSKGCNMKKIVDACTKGMDCPAHDIIKLRLRGRGSGFKEGPTKAESDEPLHMCVSSKFLDKYEIACNQVESLIKKVYQDYSKFCREHSLTIPKLTVRKQEGVSGRSTYFQDRFAQLEDSETLTEAEVDELIEMRNEARRQSNFVEADRIRELLRAKGVAVVDEKAPRVSKW